MPVDRTSLAGYAAVTGEPLVIDDAYFLPPDVEYSINRSFDERYGYRTKSMLVIPMKDHRRSEEHTSELQSRLHLVCRLLLEKKKKKKYIISQAQQKRT